MVPPPWVSSLPQDLPKPRSGWQRCNFAPRISYMGQSPQSSSLLSVCLYRDTKQNSFISFLQKASSSYNSHGHVHLLLSSAAPGCQFSLFRLSGPAEAGLRSQLRSGLLQLLQQPVANLLRGLLLLLSPPPPLWSQQTGAAGLLNLW